MPLPAPAAGPRLAGRLKAFAAAIVLTAAAFVLLPAASANAETVSGGRLDWGLRESFRTYITGPIAAGEVQLGNGASNADNGYRFHTAGGDYDPDSGDYRASYSGTVRFLGHATDDGGHELDLTIANPTIELSGSEGTLYLDVTDSAGNHRSQVAFADLSLGGLSLAGQSGTLAVQDIPATLTSAGAESFEGYYSAGEQLDPIDFTGDIVAERAEPEPSEEPEPSPSLEPAEEPDDTAVSGAALDWGVRQSWRDYVAGDIAAGRWETGDGALDGGDRFRFTAGVGTITEGGGAEIRFAGTVAFTGTDVDLAISDPVITITGDEGVLTATVSTAAGESSVALASFNAALEESGELLVVEDAATALHTDAVDAFGGFYQAGDEMDPLWLAVPASAGAELPALPDLGEEPETVSAIDAETASTEAEDGAPWLLPALVGLAVLLALLTGLGFWVRRRRDSESGEADPPASDTSADTDQSDAGKPAD